MPIIPPNQTFTRISDTLVHIIQDFPIRRRWWMLMGLAGVLLLLFAVAITRLFSLGVGIWGLNIPVVWGLAITDYVWWIGIGNAGTFISAMLLILQQDWRNSLNRFAEAMTVFAVFCAVLFPVLHLGRPWKVYYMLPYPNPLGLQPQFRSPLLWDVFANFSYLTVSVVFWYVGMIPDLATLRDRARTRWGRILFGLGALGWRGSARHWLRWRQAYLLVAALAMPLVVSVHSGVALLFAVGPIVGWHSTVFPPYFVLGAVYSGFATVILIAISLRRAFRLDNVLTMGHVERLAKWLLVTGLCTDYGYFSEAFVTLYSQNTFELENLTARLTGAYAGVTWFTYAVNLGVLQLLWFPAIRRRGWAVALIAASVVVAMYTERYMLIITALYRGYEPGTWHLYMPTFWDWAIFLGSVGLFLFLMLLFIRLLPSVSIAEVKEVLDHERREAAGGG